MKKLLVVGLAACLLTVGLMAAPASAWFTDSETVKITGKMGSVDIRCTYRVMLPRDMQPGHTYDVYVKIHENGVCPVKLTTKVTNIPGFLKVYVSPSTVARLNYCSTVQFHIRVVVPSWIGDSAQDKLVALYFTVFAQNL